MPQGKYIPTNDAQKAVWFNNFTAKLPAYTTQLGISAAELASVQADNVMYQYIINMLEQYKQTQINLTSYKNMLKHAIAQQHIGAIPGLPSQAPAPPAVAEGVFDRVSKLVTRIKASLAYSDNIGADLGIIAVTETVDPATMQPELKIKLDVGRPHLKWIKGYSDAIDLYANHNDGAGFVLIGRLTKNEYIDITVMGAGKVFDEWNYKAIYVIADVPVGLYSNVTSIDVKKV